MPIYCSSGNAVPMTSSHPETILHPSALYMIESIFKPGIQLAETFHYQAAAATLKCQT